MAEVTTPVYLITGFLESGKTTFLQFTLEQDYFRIDGKTLLILCEEGEAEYDLKKLAMMNTVVEVIESEEDFTTERLNTLDILHMPERVLIEYNGMWNMKSQFMDMVRNTDMVIFNRCKKTDPLAQYRRGIKVANQRAEVVFEDESGEIGDIFKDEMPFDINAPVIDILPEDYGIWFVDAMDNPENYQDKVVHFKGRALKPRGLGSKFFVPGRTAMTCCADDTTFLGFVCKSSYTPKLKDGQWVDVTARAQVEDRKEYQGKGLVLYAENVEPCEPLPEEMVYFN